MNYKIIDLIFKHLIILLVTFLISISAFGEILNDAKYTIENPAITGVNQYIEFDINIASLLNSEEFYKGEIYISYESLTFGVNLASSGRISISKGTVISASNYSLTLTDVTQDKIKITAESIYNASSYYTISSQSEQLIHIKINITNLSGNTDINFDELSMQGLTEYFDANLSTGILFDSVHAEDDLDIDIIGSDCNCTFTNNNVNSWYYKGNQKNIDYQKDIFVFRLNNLQSLNNPFNNSIVDSVSFQNATGLKYNIVYFNPLSTITQRELIRNQIKDRADFDIEFPAVTEYPNSNYSQKKWFYSNDIVNVVFHSADSANIMAQYIASKYNLIIDHEPSVTLPKGNNSWTFAFKINSEGCNCRNAIDVAREIYQNDSLIVKISEPWLEPSAEASATNDTYFSDQWQIDNTGQCLGMSIAGSGTAGADCNVQAAWNMGYTGNGIKVAVIDKSIFENNHPDISSKYIGGYDYIDNDNDVSASSGPSSVSRPHGQACAGLIAAKANNNIGIAGVAYDAQIVPIICWYGNAYKGFQYALDSANADVISCSWGWEGNPSQAIENDIALCKTLGRNGKGIITVVSAGNDNTNTTNYFPGYLDDVIGVIATNPDDTRKSPSDGWATWGSNYGPKHDVAAPGTHLISTDLMNGGYNDVFNGCPQGNNLNNGYTYFNGTSSAAPIAAGACAVNLSSDPNLSASQVQTKLENTANKVGGYNYNAVSTGRSLEMGYGRINFGDAVLSNNVLEFGNDNILKIYPNPSNSRVMLEFSLDKSDEVRITIYDNLGRVIATPISNQFYSSQNPQMVSLNISNLANGMYYITLHVGNSLHRSKLIIAR